MSRRALIGVLLAAVLSALAPAAARAADFTVNAAGDHTADGCDPAPADCTMRDAVAAANANTGADTITVPAGTYALSLGALIITGPVTISGPATTQPTATVDAAYSDRLFDVSAAATAVTISHLRVRRGQTNEPVGGSGLIQRGGTVTLDHTVFDALSNNLAGGALLLQSGTLNITDTEISGNHGYSGAGLHIVSGTANIDRTLWLDNDISGSGGGAIYNAGGTLSVTNSTFAVNYASASRGGAIYAASSTALKNVTFEANLASGSGGGGSALWVAASTTTANVLFGNSGYQDNCGGSAPTELGGSVDTGASCGLAPAASERTVLLGPLMPGGGSARSMLQWAGSAGIDAGNNAECMPADQRGTVRPHTVQDPCDAGAVEGSGGTAPAPVHAGGSQHDTTETSVLLDATIDRHGLPTSYVVEYGLTSAYGSTSQFGGAVPFGTGSGPQPVTDYLIELMPGTTYHYRFVATSAAGTTTGEDRTFTTQGPPQVTTRPASGVSETGATLNGTINPSGDDTTYWFEYGPTTAYGSSTAPSGAGAGFSAQAVGAVVSGLEPGTTQHFRLVAINEFSATPVAGEDFTFTTATPPTATPTPTPTPTPDATVTPPPTVSQQPGPTPAPTPLFSEIVVVKPVSGKVLVRRPGSKDFVELDATNGVPDGSTIDTKRGVVELTSISRTGQLQTARFRDGIFRVNQSGATTDLTLTEPLAACKKASASAKKKPKSRKLWGDGRGAFRTVGRHSAATVRGTKWLVQDTCAGTLTKVVSGVVAVRDNVKRKTIVLRAGKSYLARPRPR